MPDPRFPPQPDLAAPFPPARTRPPAATACFLDWARRTPEAPAIHEHGRVWSYAGLAATARAIAGRIRAAGCQPGDVVAIDDQRGGDFVAALIGTLMARCVALPLDPGQPPAWRVDALEQADARLLLRGVGARLPTRGRAHLDLSGIEGTPEESAEENAGANAGDDNPAPDDAAYLFFTSGTTGRPRGVLGGHGGLGQFLAWQRDSFAVAPGDRVAHVTGLGFDVVLREILVALTAGATLSIPDRVVLEDPARLTRWLADDGITLLHAVPTLAAAWLAEADPTTRFPRLRATFFAGEPLTRQLALRWRERLDPAADILNLYGPTETTLAKCWYRLPARLPFDQLPVGVPLPECEIHILDEAGRPVPPGEPGEVVIRTPWRALGHLDGTSPFRRNPSRDDPADLLHFTGDRGHLLADGNLALLGRLDDQVKIRGVRVQPAGVAAVLATHPAVAACAVLARTAAAEPGLAAFVVGDVGRAELRHHLAERLADAMVPGEFHFLPELPHTGNGKLDRARLAELLVDRHAAPESASGRAPGSASEHRVATVFRELLGLPLTRRLSVDDDFFDLGGDSLRALAAISRLNQGIGGRLDVADLFEAPDIRALAERLDALQGTLPTSAAIPLRVVARDRNPPMSPVQERIWFQCQLDGELAVAYNVPVAIEIHGRLDVPILDAALRTVSAHHEVLRTTFPTRDGHAFQSVHAPTPEPLRRIDLGDLEDAAQTVEIHRLAQEQADRPFLLERERPLRTLLLKRADDRHLLLLTVHHLAFDGWSRWLLAREIGEHYTALSKGLPTAPAPPIQYVDYAVWRRQSPPRADSLAYWRRHLRNPPGTDLPTDFPRPAQPSRHGTRIVRELSGAILADVEAVAARERATLYMLLLTAFQLVLSRWTGATDLTVGSPVANRPRPELESLIGCFIEMLPIRADLSGARTGVEALRQIRHTVIDVFSHADTPFEKIVEHIAPPRRPGHHPLFDVMFNFVNVPQGTADPEGLTFRFADWTAPEAKFDLSVYAHRKGDGLELQLVYKTALFQTERMTRLLDAIVETLEQIADNPSRPLAQLRIDVEPRAARASTTGASTMVDVRADDAPATPRRHVAPRDGDEAEIAAVFRELLGLERVSVHDNFFALGGHSLLAMQAISRLRRRFGAELPLRLMFASQTVAELAPEIRRALAEPGIETGAGVPVTPNQQRILRFMADHPCSAHYNVARKLRLRGHLDADRLERAINQVAARHAVLATRYPDIDTPMPGQRDAKVPLDHADASAEADPDAAANRLIASEIARPFALDRGPLLRALLIRVAEREHVLLLVIHHVVADCRSMGMSFELGDASIGAWMAGVFFRQLWACYQEPRAGDAAALAEPVHQFDDVARRQCAWLASPEAARQLAYWRQVLTDRPAALEIPPDFPRPPAWDFRGARQPLRIEPELAAGLRAYARAQGTTLFVVFQAAFAVLLRQLTGSTDLVTGTTVGNRGEWAAEELIGYFSNNLVLRTHLDGDPDFQEITRRAHDTAFAAFARQELSFEQLLRELDVEPAPDRHPLFQVRLVLHLPTDPPFANEALSMTLEATGLEVAKYDLTLLLADVGDGFTGWLEYATSLYHPTTAARIVERYCRLLPALLAEPRRPLSEIPANPW